MLRYFLGSTAFYLVISEFTSLSPSLPRYLRFYLVTSRKFGVSQRDSSIFFTPNGTGHNDQLTMLRYVLNSSCCIVQICVPITRLEHLCELHWAHMPVHLSNRLGLDCYLWCLCVVVHCGGYQNLCWTGSLFPCLPYLPDYVDLSVVAGVWCAERWRRCLRFRCQMSTTTMQTCCTPRLKQTLCGSKPKTARTWGWGCIRFSQCSTIRTGTSSPPSQI